MATTLYIVLPSTWEIILFLSFPLLFSISLSVSIVSFDNTQVCFKWIDYLEMMGIACLAWTINNHDTAMSWAHHKPSSCDFKLQFVIGRFECCGNQACSYPVRGHISPAPATATGPGVDADCQCQAGYKCQLGLITPQNNANSGDKVATKQQYQQQQKQQQQIQLSLA